MSPEYAVHGLFSTKSDIFSFGVIVLEIISGKRNTTFYEANGSLNLLGYVSKPMMFAPFTHLSHAISLKNKFSTLVSGMGNLERRAMAGTHGSNIGRLMHSG